MPNTTLAKLETKPRISVDMHKIQITVNPLNGSHYKHRQTKKPDVPGQPKKTSDAWTCLDNAKPMPSQGCGKTCPMFIVAMVPGGCCDDRPHNKIRSQGLPHIIQHACNMP